MLANLPAKTGKPLGDWLRIVASEKLDKHGQLVDFLKSAHGVTHGFANLIASKHLEAEAPSDPIAVQYSWAKAALKPIHDEIMAYAHSLGGDIEVARRKTA